MNKSEILYEPIPIGRIGIKKETEEVVAAKDFSCFALMLEEYISYGTVNIVMPSSFPEIKILDQMPKLLQDRIRIIDDSKEIESVDRVLYNVRKEFGANFKDDSRYLTFPKGTDTKIIESIDLVHSLVQKLSIGFNYGIQVDLSTVKSIEALRLIRKKAQNANSRLVLAQLEGLLNQYTTVQFDAIALPKEGTPYQLITTLDKLINDKTYLDYSNSLTLLAIPDKREQALVKIREVTRTIKSKDYFSISWDFLAKVVTAWTGAPIPESKEISIIIQGKALPTLVNMDIARKNAVEIWKNSQLTQSPLRRDGLPITSEDIQWIPPLGSMKIRSEDNKYFSFGTVKELLDALTKVQELFNHTKEEKTRHNTRYKKLPGK